MQRVDLLNLQTQRGARVTGGVIDTAAKSIDTVIRDCRKAIEQESENLRGLDPAEKTDRIKQIIMDFVMNTKPLVEGYRDAENKPDTVKLLDKLIEEITDYGILANAMADPDVFEIRCNGRELKVEIKGHVQDLKDKDGNTVYFDSPEQQEIIMKKMLGDTRLTPKEAIISGSTVEGYRIAANHSSVSSLDPGDPLGDKYNTFVLRKFNKVKMALPDIVLKHTMSDNMARLLALSTAGNITWFTVGPTASGKSTTNNAILMHVPNEIRTVLLQNPSEIDIRRKDEMGHVVNDVLHLEAREFDDPRPTDPTMENLMNQVLRLSPTLVCLGEIRSNEEFKAGTKILMAGHPINTTFHAEDARGAIMRYLTAYLACSGNEPSYLALSNICSLVNLIIVQKIMRDGYRRVIQITEVLGVDPKDKNEPLLNDLYRFEVDGDPDYNPDGTVKLIKGIHKRVGKMSDRMIRKFQLEGVAKSRFDFMLKDVDDTEVETYTGINIDNYGKTAVA